MQHIRINFSNEKNVVSPSKDIVPVCLDDFERLASGKINKMAWEYYSSGAMDEFTLKLNRQAYDDIFIVPRYGKDVQFINTTTTLFGSGVSVPFGSAPTAMHKLSHPEGECATARACRNSGTVTCLSTFSTCSIEDVVKAVDDSGEMGVLWQQLYLLRGEEGRRESANLVKRADAAGFKALVLTIDTAQLGTRLHNQREKMILPVGISHANFKRTDRSALPEQHESLDWNVTIPYLRTLTTMPILLKGILSIEDAIQACESGADGIVVSNHGGRQLDGVPAPIQVLGGIANAVRKWETKNGRKIVIVVDGGIHRGTDVFKAICLGADFCFIGRPILYALSWGGCQGVELAFLLLKQELENTLALAGVPSIEEAKGRVDLLLHKTELDKGVIPRM
jgi:(S)-2-hydroxy-acid oxidase